MKRFVGIKFQGYNIATAAIRAFTLAETLIAITIIGIIAALTTPTLIHNYKQRTTIIKLRKVQNDLIHATKMAILEHGTPDRWGMAPKVPIEDEDGNIIGYDTSSIDVERAYISKYLKGENCDYLYDCANLPNTLIYYNLSKTTADRTNEVIKFPYFKTTDGTVIQFTNVSNSDCIVKCADIEVFIPNGDDIYHRGVNNFMFILTKKGIELPGGPDSPFYTFEKDCNMQKNAETNGHGCTAWVLLNENMDYLHCDDLSWDGKHKCSD